MQPCYVPWLGHLRLIALVDKFVILDDAQYSRNSWHNRNRILLADGRVVWLTVPVSHDGVGAPLNEVRVDVDPRWQKKHVQTLQQSYGKHGHFTDLRDIIELIGNFQWKYLAELNSAVLEFAVNQCEFGTEVYRSSSLGITETRTRKLEMFCDLLGCQTYVSTPGSQGYLDSDSFGRTKGLKVEYMNIEFPQYPQRNATIFTPNLSFVDALANIGWGGVRRVVFRDN